MNSLTAPKVAIVTGGTFGIGKAITLTLARRGYRVVSFGLEGKQISSIAERAIPALRDEAKAEGLEVELLEADVSIAGDVARVVDFTLGKYGRVDALINNAAIGPLGTVIDTDEATWDRIFAVNTKGVFLSSKAVLPNMIDQG
ncbi:MAG: SDR family NAD(P)-dependent oxidoreductase, partial [Pseudorhodoplanes sp.]